MGLGCEAVDAEVLAQPTQSPLQQARHWIIRGAWWKGVLNVLRLSALTVWGDDQSACDAVRCLRSQTGSNQVQASIQSGCCPRGRQHVSVIDVEHSLIEEYIGVPVGQGVEGLPVCDGRTSAQEAGIGDGDGAKAKPQDSYAAPVSLLKDLA